MKFIRFFEEIGMHDIALVGGKNASLGEMIQHLSSQGIAIPTGFAITAEAYRYHLSYNNLNEPIQQLLATLDHTIIASLEDVGSKLRNLITEAPLPPDLVQEIYLAYHSLEQRYGNNCDVAIRSSATAEDLPEASFAGQQDTYLNISGAAAITALCPQAFASLFTNRAISYRINNDFDHIEVALSLGVQKMVRSDLASAGVLFTLDTESGHPDVIFITSAYGLGENVVQGSVNPDEFYVHKQTLRNSYKPILKKRMGSKSLKMTYAEDGKQTTINTEVNEQDRTRYSLNDDEILQLARYALLIEDYYSEKIGRWMPMDIEWAKDGRDGNLYIVQARPETVHSQRQHATTLTTYRLTAQPTTAILARGKSIGKKIVSGKARIISSAKNMQEVLPGDILITAKTDPDWEPIMKRAGGIVTEQGGRTCHAAIISRELGIPAIVGTHDATSSIANGAEITLDCSSGEEGIVYAGALPFTASSTEITSLPKIPVDIMVNVGNPDEAFTISRLPNDGVGLARLEFIINTSIQIHPLALVYPDRVTNAHDQAAIAQLTAHYPNKQDFFVATLAQEAGTIAAAFYPKPVIIRMSDFKSNEYRQLIGGSDFEPHEENPMIGFRGASRYYHPAYQEAFALECKAMKYLRDEMGFTNVKLMLPFVRTLHEAATVIELMATHGLRRGVNGLEIYMMCEIPSNVLLIEDFAHLFDGFSIGSNDLTQMTLAIDRDSALIAPLFDERDPAVKKMLSMAITGAKKQAKKIGICGQAPSDYPELAHFLINEGIDSLSLNPDSVITTIIALGKTNK